MHALSQISRSSLISTQVYHGVKRLATYTGRQTGEKEAFEHLAATADFDALVELYSLPWFTRAWIVQEATLSRALHIMWGTLLMSYEEFSFATAVLHSLLQTFEVSPGKLMFSHIQKAWDVVSTRTAFHEKRNQDLDTVHEPMFSSDNIWRPLWQGIRLFDYVQTMDRECFDPRDKIYALLGLRDKSDIQLEPDYNMSVVQVFTKFAGAYLERGYIKTFYQAGIQRNMNYPSLWENLSNMRSENQFPSWVPDWRVPRPSLELGGSSRESFSAATKLAPKLEVDFRELEIHVAGYRFDVVKERQGVLELGQNSSKPMRYATHEKARASIVELFEFYKSHVSVDPYPTGEDRRSVFARTIMVDGHSPSFESMFPNWRSSEGLTMIWTIFQNLKIKPDDGLDLDSKVLLAHPQTGEPSDRARTVRTAWLVMAFMFTVTNNRCLIITEGSVIGLAPALTEVGDVVAIFAGAETPFILRPRHEAHGYSLLGDCYIHGIMKGELTIERLQERMETLTIV